MKVNAKFFNKEEKKHKVKKTTASWMKFCDWCNSLKRKEAETHPVDHKNEFLEK
jgi:hypothetical protein